MQATVQLPRSRENLKFDIAVAGFEDLGDLVIMADEGLAILPNYKHMERDRSRMASSFTSWMSNPNNIVMIARIEGVAIGAMACYIEQFWFSDRIFSENIFLFVVPRWRGGNVAGTLLNIYKQWAKARGVDDICFDASSGTKPEKMQKFLEFHGFRAFGCKLVWEQSDGKIERERPPNND